MVEGPGGRGGGVPTTRQKNLLSRKSRRHSHPPAQPIVIRQQARKQSSKLFSEGGKAALGSNLQSSSCLVPPRTPPPHPTPLLSASPLSAQLLPSEVFLSADFTGCEVTRPFILLDQGHQPPVPCRGTVHVGAHRTPEWGNSCSHDESRGNG